MAQELQGKRALVTGSSAGIGEGIARLFVEQGAQVFIHGRDPKRTEQVARSMDCPWAMADLKDAAQTGALIAAVEAKFGGVDILVNNAGGEIADGGAVSSFQATPEQWMATYNANWISALRLIQAFAPGMKARNWGRISRWRAARPIRRSRVSLITVAPKRGW